MPNTKARTVTAPTRTAGGRFAAKTTTVSSSPANGAPALEIALPADLAQRKICDEYGELSRQLQRYAPIIGRHEVLKKAIKSWFDSVPPDAEATIEGAIYQLHISARERERHVRDLREIVDRIGLDKFLELVIVPITALQSVMGTKEIDALLVETRSGSRRIRCIPKFPAVPPT